MSETMDGRKEDTVKECEGGGKDSRGQHKGGIETLKERVDRASIVVPFPPS